MEANGTETVLNSSQPACSFLGNYSWREEYLMPTNFILIIVAVSAEAVMIPFTVLFNALMIFLVWRKRYLRKQKPCVLLACLAATDLMVGAVVLPLVITGHALRLSRAPVCVVDAVTLESLFIACGASMYHLVIVSGERYVAIKHSLRYKTLVTTRRLTAAVATAWAISLVSTLSGLINIVVKSKNAQVAGVIFDAITFLGFPVCFAAICFCQVVVFLESQRHRRDIRAHQVSEDAARDILKKDKAARTTTIVVGALLLCYAPVTACHAVISAADLPMSVALGPAYLTDVFLFFNCILNPIIYCLRTQDFRRALRELFGHEVPQVIAQAADIPLRVVRRRISEAPRPSSGENLQIAPSDRAHARRSRSHSLDGQQIWQTSSENRRNSV